eukprot:gene36602-44403_t
MSTEPTNDDEYEEVLAFVSFPELANADFISDDKVFLFENLSGANPKCTLDGMVFEGKQTVQLGSMLYFCKEDAKGEDQAMRFLGHSINGVPFKLKLPQNPSSTNARDGKE